jgi:phospholipase C
VPGLVVTNLARPRQVVHDGPFEHCSSLALIESTFGLRPLTARDKHARNLREVLRSSPVPAREAVRPSSIPTSSNVIGPAISPPSESLVQVLEGTASFDPAAICSAGSTQSVSPPPVNKPAYPQTFGGIPGLTGTSGMADMLKSYRSEPTESG